MAFNEEANIRLLLEALLRQRLTVCKISKIIVVASGCTDNTEQVVESIAECNRLVELLVQENREGKASAINLFLSKAEGDVIVIESADTIPEEDTIEELVRPFQDTNVGMAGAHPVPVNSDATFMGFTVHLFWRLHHLLALGHPKLGELIAFRNIVPRIPQDTAVDEATIEAIITKAGYRVFYAKDAIVRNKGPDTVRDFLKQRRRIGAGHRHLRKTLGYMVSTMEVRNLLGLFAQVLRDTPCNLRIILWTCGSILLEIIGRLLGEYDYYIKRKNPFAWEIAETTKNLADA